MKKTFKVILLLCILLSLVLSGCASSSKIKVEAVDKTIPDNSRIPSKVAKVFDYEDGSQVVVKVYNRHMDEYPCYPLFKYVDTMNQALRYKLAHPTEDVTVHFAMYHLALNTYYYFNENDPKYGEITSDYIPGTTENIMQAAVRLAKHQVTVKFLDQAMIGKDFEPYMNEACITDSSKKVKDYLTYWYARWGGASEEQMHCKFITVNKVMDDNGKEFSDVVYLASSNIDPLYDNFFKSTQERAQSGMLIMGNKGLYDAFNKYQQIICRNYDNQKGFWKEVKEAHAAGTLNYRDKYFNTHFTPVLSVIEPDPFAPDKYSPEVDKESAWDTENNVFAKYVDEMAASDQGPRLFYANVYHYKTSYVDLFGWKLFNKLKGLYYAEGYDNSSCTYTKEEQEAEKAKKPKVNKKSPLTTKWVIETSTTPHRFSNNSGFRSGMDMISNNQALYHKADKIYKTHCKDVIMSYTKDGLEKYVTITGSTNLKRDGNAQKANASVAVIEDGTDHSIFDAYKAFVDEIITTYRKK